MWEGRQSLGLTDPLGQHDVPIPPMCAPSSWRARSTAPAALPLATQAPFGNCQQQPNPNPQLWTMRALMSALTAWVLDDVTPPESAVPRIAEGTLVSPDQVRFPPIPANRYGGVERPAASTARVHDTLHVLDFGPLYRAQDFERHHHARAPARKISKLWRAGDAGRCRRQRYRRRRIGVLASADRHLYGLEFGRKDRFENGMCNLQGSFIPFAATRAERLAVGDPRLSIEERYPTKESYLAAFKKAADGLVAGRYLLPDDAKLLVERAEKEGIRTGP